jgi:nucleoid-associated protein YejK
VFDYRLACNVEVNNSDKEMQALIMSRRDVPTWKENNDSKRPEITFYYSRSGLKINDVF